ncbi:MAG: Gfo/Idh/MocA family oxidoreductase [Candidatus Omnitrophica bacterium]|nr:Gfo/Idh/MocA family oxidoreductase [Candidatus Omnitrophota bacterium]MBU1523432.1 Gfo/Idh/MocA family oxidoreductase [Candidatus Omnitrophota bacterium]MBU2437146.1 Gfo/Idh/MocA family oxidoreductase [Candidatus Omnitrophota bacterium]
MSYNVGIIGIGKLGSIHLRIYKELKEIEKIYLVDINQKNLAPHKNLPSFKNYRELKNKVDLVSIATPTPTHFEIAKFFLETKIPVLVEKPLTMNYKRAEKLIEISKKKKTLLFVGHVERYNNAYIAVKKIVKDPLFIECNRLSPYPYRSLDTSVVSDLMIHDLDIILSLVKDKIKKIEAKGVKVLSTSEDIANARITFEKGCVANITSSRISSKKERKIRIFMPNCYISLDYAQQTVEIYQKLKKKIVKKILPIEKEQPLQKEIADFLNLVKKGNFNIESAEQAKDAIKLACKIEKIIKVGSKK